MGQAAWGRQLCMLPQQFHAVLRLHGCVRLLLEQCAFVSVKFAASTKVADILYITARVCCLGLLAVHAVSRPHGFV
jgi:hypothetical protein